MSDDLLRNITTEDALQEQIGQFRAILENSPNIIARFDRNFRYLYINRPVFNAKIGRIAARIGDSIDDIGLSEDEIELRKQKIRYVFETGQPTSLESEFPGRYGNQWFDARFVPEFAPDGTVASVLVFSRDVTERKQMEIALRENKTRFREVLEHSFDAAYRRNL
ncbi:MAG: PAS domain-containing protein, partial [Desulfobacteraceae bacterium]|nr:PAS domain-containing protein [Desulfobacteraceae bacterium]